MAVTDAAQMAAIVRRGLGRSDLDSLCSTLMRLVAKAEAYQTTGDAVRLEVTLEIIGERLDQINEVREAFIAAKTQGGAA